jgi:hypothetical protein
MLNCEENQLCKQDYILLIMNCKRYKHKAKIQKEKWLKHLPSFLIYYHVIGVPSLDTEYIFSENERLLYVRVEDDYNSLPQKVIAAYNAIYKKYVFQYIFKTDDDQEVLNNRFFDMVKTLIEKNTKEKHHYGGQIVEVLQPHYSKYHYIHNELPANLPILPTKYCSGRFYFLSFDAVKDLLNKITLFIDEYFEDYAIGSHLNDKLKLNMLHIQSDCFLIDYKYDV